MVEEEIFDKSEEIKIVVLEDEIHFVLLSGDGP